jgi:outer membrane protein
MHNSKLFFLLLFTFVLHKAKAQTKVCFVNPTELFNKMDDTRKGAEELQLYKEKLSKELSDFETQVNTGLEKFIKDSAKLSPAVKEAKRNELQKAIADLSAKKPALNNMIDAKAIELDSAIKQKLNTAIKKIATANGYNHILVVDAAILYPKADEITEKVALELGIK